MVEMPKKLQFWSLEKLKPYERNSREHSPEQIKRIAESMKTFGFTNPILVDGDNGIIAGHGRLAAAKELGLDKVPVIQLEHLTDEQRRAYIIADNRLAELSTWNNEILKSELSELQELGFDLELIGFDQEQLTEIMPPEKSEPLADEDAVPEVEDAPVVKRGDTWILGNHRLRCGDSTSAEDVTLLMNGERADMVFTDPPYNLASETPMSKTTSSKAHAKLQDSSWDKDFKIEPVLQRILECAAKDISVYVCTSHFLLPEILVWMHKNFDKSHVCVWSKPNPMPSLTKRHWTWSLELIPYATNGNHVFNFPQEGHAPSVWTMNKPARNDLHPTQKPVEIPEHAILHSSNAGQRVLDLFGGSGSTLIACEKTGRKCFMMELDEKYVQVIIKRWQEYTGKDAYHAETGETFNSLASK